MPMTQDELVDLDKLLCRMMKEARGWRFMRWFGLVMGIFLIGLTVLQLSTLWNFVEIKDANEPVNASDLILVKALCLCAPAAIFTMATGMGVVIYSLTRWRKGRRDVLLIRMAQSWLESQQSAP